MTTRPLATMLALVLLAGCASSASDPTGVASPPASEPPTTTAAPATTTSAAPVDSTTTAPPTTSTAPPITRDLALDEPVTLTEDVSYGDDPLQVYDVFHRDGAENAPVVFLFHGSGGTHKTLHPLADWYTPAGFVVVSIDFTRTPEHDMWCAMAHFQQNAEAYGADPDTFIGHGTSFGGRSSAVFYNQYEDWSRGCDVPDADLGLVGYVGHSSNNIGHTSTTGAVRHIDADDPPVLFLFGADDPKFDPSEPEEFVALLDDVGVDGHIHVEPGIGHGPESHADNATLETLAVEFARRVIG